MYGTEVAGLVRNRSIKKLTDLVYLIYEQFSDRREIVKSLELNKLGMVLIRPEAIGFSDKYELMLDFLGLKVIFKKTVQLDFSQYWALYHHGLICPDAEYDFPTRTMNYINKNCKLLILYSNNENLYPLADYITSIKGKQGVYNRGTLRGDIAFNELKSIISNEDKNSFLYPEYNLYFDPIGMCRHLVRGNIDSDEAHKIADIPLLFYTGQAVHVPNSNEILNDLSVLCSEKDLCEIQESAKVLKKGKKI